MFATFTQSLSRYLIVGDPDLVSQINAAQATADGTTKVAPGASHRHSKSTSQQFVYDPSRVDKMFDMLVKYEENFARHLKILLDTLNYLAATETVVFLSLCARLSSAGEGGFIAAAGEGAFGANLLTISSQSEIITFFLWYAGLKFVTSTDYDSAFLLASGRLVFLALKIP
jgi:gamma-tubulin complex component 2